MSAAGTSDPSRPDPEGVERKLSSLAVVAGLTLDSRLRFGKAFPSVLVPRYPE